MKFNKTFLLYILLFNGNLFPQTISKISNQYILINDISNKIGYMWGYYAKINNEIEFFKENKLAGISIIPKDSILKSQKQNKSRLYTVTTSNAQVFKNSTWPFETIDQLSADTEIQILDYLRLSEKQDTGLFKISYSDKQKGDTLSIYRNMDKIGLIEIVKINNSQAACKIIYQKENFKIGDSIIPKESKLKSQITNRSGLFKKTISEASVFQDTTFPFKVIDQLPAGTEIQLLDCLSRNGVYAKTLFKISYSDRIGYIWDYHTNCENDKEIEDYKYKKLDEQIESEHKRKEMEERKAKEKEENKRKKYVTERKNSLIQKYGIELGNKLADKHIDIGMTKEMVLDSWGNPQDINRTVYANYVHEQWVYSNIYLYFENGILTSWQD